MKFYFIVSSDEDTPTQNLLEKLKGFGKVVIVKHQGPLAKIEDLKKDKEIKILALDPGVFDWNLDVESVKNIPNVKAVCTSSTSFDWLKPKELRTMGIIACNIPGFSKDSVAEYALCMAIEVARRVPIMVKNGWKYDFNQSPTLLKGKVAGIIGLGRIGTRMAELCQAIGMEVIYWSRQSQDKRFRKVDIDILFKTADLIMPALVESDETKKIVTHKRLDLMKPTAFLVGINRVRAIWDEAYVLAKVKKGEIAGYAFEGEDVKEPSAYEGNVWSLPAMAWFTKDSLENLMKIWVDNIKAVAQGKPQNVVN